MDEIDGLNLDWGPGGKRAYHPERSPGTQFFWGDDLKKTDTKTGSPPPPPENNTSLEKGPV